jgi:hypothetical protein
MMTNDLERRVKTLEEELNGEKHLTRYAVDQTRRNGEVLHALRNDFRLLRGEMTELRAGQEAINVRLDTFEHNFAARFDAIEHNVAAIERNVAVRFDTFERNVAARFDTIEHNVAARFDTIEHNVAAIQHNVAAILAAVVPGGPPPA